MEKEAQVPHFEKINNQNKVLVEEIKQAGYTLDFVEFNKEKNWPEFNFTRKVDDKNLYPHFHLITNFQNYFNLHLDTRTHRAKSIGAEISHELERLYKRFRISSESRKDEFSKEILSSFTKQLLNLSLFHTPKKLHEWNERSEWVLKPENYKLQTRNNKLAKGIYLRLKYSKGFVQEEAGINTKNIE